MMTDEARRELGRTRRLIFQNIANGVPIDKIRADFGLSELEVDQVRRFVAKKITEHLFLRRQPTIPCDDVRAIRWHRRELLGALTLIGDIDLSKIGRAHV